MIQIKVIAHVYWIMMEHNHWAYDFTLHLLLFYCRLFRLYLCFNFSIRISTYWFFPLYLFSSNKVPYCGSSKTLFIYVTFFLHEVSLLDPRLAIVMFLSRTTCFLSKEGRKPILISNELPKLVSVLFRSVWWFFIFVFICFPDAI